MTINRINVPDEKLVEICKRHKISELALFGSALTNEFKESSDVDLLYVFGEDALRSLFNIVRIKEELEKLFGRPVDFISRKAIEQSRNIYRKKAILENVKIIYAA